jgi:hemerythrin-like domain-containing protein
LIGGPQDARMDSATPLHVTPRRPGEPQADLTGYTLVHRAIRADITRLSSLLTALAVSGRPISSERAAAITTYVTSYNAAVRLHHQDEEDVLWPVIAASAGEAVDLNPYQDDHHVLEPLQSRCDELAERFAADPATHTSALAQTLRELDDLLHEHLDQEEYELFHVIRRHVSVDDYAAACSRIQRRTSPRDAGWTIPWLARHSGPAELALIPGQAKEVRVFLKEFARLETAVFGRRLQTLACSV